MKLNTVDFAETQFKVPVVLTVKAPADVSVAVKVAGPVPDPVTTRE
jgi:hypothetical protein